MAKAKPVMPKLLQPNAPDPESDRPGPARGDKTATVSVGLKQSEIARLGEIAAENGVTRNNLMAYVLRRFIHDYGAGKINLAKDTTIVKRL